MVSKVQSLKLDTSVWSNEIVQVRAHSSMLSYSNYEEHKAHRTIVACVAVVICHATFLKRHRSNTSCSSCLGTTVPTSSGPPGCRRRRNWTLTRLQIRGETSSPRSTERAGTDFPILDSTARRSCSRSDSQNTSVCLSVPVSLSGPHLRTFANVALSTPRQTEAHFHGRFLHRPMSTLRITSHLFMGNPHFPLEPLANATA